MSIESQSIAKSATSTARHQTATRGGGGGVPTSVRTTPYSITPASGGRWLFTAWHNLNARGCDARDESVRGCPLLRKHSKSVKHGLVSNLHLASVSPHAHHPSTHHYANTIHHHTHRPSTHHHSNTPSINTNHPRAAGRAHPSPSPLSTQSRANLGLKADILKGMFRDGHTKVLRHHRADVAGVQIGISNLGLRWK